MSAGQDSVALDVNMDDSEHDGENAVPKSTKKKKMKPRIQPLKRKATGPSSSSIAARKINMSLNNSVVKQTLRSNNRSLARALEMARQEYSVLQQQFVALQTRQIDCERRMKKRLTDVRAVLDVVSSKLVTSVSLLEEAQALCAVDQDLDATTITPCADAPTELPEIRPRPVPQRNILTTQQPENAEVPPSINITSPVESQKLSDEESPSRSLEEDETGALGDVIENMKADITHAITSLQGHRAPPVSIAPADVSVVMEMSTLMDQLPPMFDEVDKDAAQTGPAKRERAHSRSRSGRRSAMIYRAGGSLDNVNSEAEPAPDQEEERGPRRSIRARSRSRQRPRKTYNEDQEEETTADTKESHKETTSTDKDEDADRSVVSKLQTAVEKSKVASEEIKDTTEDTNEVIVAQEDPTLIENDHLLKVFVPRNEIPRTPPSRRTSEILSQKDTEEVEPETCGIEIPRFISFETDTSSKAAKKRLSVPKKKAQRNLVAQTKKGKKTSMTATESQPAKTVDDEKITPENPSPSEKVSRRTEEKKCSEQSAEPEVSEKEVVQNSPSPKKETTEEAVIIPVKEPKSRRSHLRRGTFCLDTQPNAVVDATDLAKTLKDAESSERPRRQRRGTYCMTAPEPAPNKEALEDTVPESPPIPAADNLEKKQKKQEQRQKRGTYFVESKEEKEETCEGDADFGEEIVNEQEITLIDDLDDDLSGNGDDPYGGTTICCEGNTTEEKCVDDTKYGEEDMELTEVIDFAAFNLEAKFPVPAFIRKEQSNEGAEEAVEDENRKETTKSRGKLVLKPKLRKKKRGGKDAEISESKSETCSVEEISVEESSVSKAEKKRRGKDADNSDNRTEENKSVEESSEKEHSSSKDKKRRGEDENSKEDDLVKESTEESSASKSTEKTKRRGKDTESHDRKSDIGKYLFEGESQGGSSGSKENTDAQKCRNVVNILDSTVDSDDAFKKPDVKLIKPLAKVKAAALKEQKKNNDSSSETSSDSDREKPKFQTMSSRPGKIVFRAGRKKVEDLKPSTQKAAHGKTGAKVKSLLPRPDRPRSKSARSKTRLLSLDTEMKLGFNEEEKKKEEGPPKSVFDMSLNESITVLPQMKYGDFREQNPTIEAMKEALKSNQKEEELPSTGTHGIMLVMGNGKRTKPRVRSKSVTYSRNLAEVHLRTPSASSSSDVETPRNVKEFAGKTPPKKKLKPEQPKSEPKDSEPINDLKDEETLIPDTPDIKITKKAKRTMKSKDSAPKIDSLTLSTNDTMESGRDSMCSVRSSLSSVADDSTVEKTDSQSSSMPAPSETRKSQPKKRLSLAKPKCKEEEVIVCESPRNSAKKSSSSTKAAAKASTEKDNNTSASSRSSVSSTTKRSLNAHEEFKMPFDDIEPKRPRRGTAQVSYKELSLNAKLRRGDPISTSLYKEGEHKMSTGKDRKSGKRSRSVLNTITNVPLDDH